MKYSLPIRFNQGVYIEQRTTMAADFGLAELQKLTVLELQQELKRRGLKKSGIKAKLIERLFEHIQQSKDEENQLSDQQQENDNDTSIGDLNSKDTTQDYEDSCNPVVTAEASNDDTARDFAEEFTNAIHKTADDDSLDNRQVKMPQDIEEEYTNDLPPASNLSENSSDAVQSSVAVIHQQSEVGEEDESNLSIPLNEEVSMDFEETNKVELKQDANEESENSNDNSQDKSQEEDEKENLISNVLHVDVQDDKETHEDALDYGEIEDDLHNKEVEEDSEKENADNEPRVASQQHKEIEVVEAVKLKKTVTPVHIKKRVSLTATSETTEEKAEKRKRRWGSTSIKEPSVTISTESMKKLIPDVKIDASALENAPELDYRDDDGNEAGDAEESTYEEEQDDEKEHALHRVTPSKKRRTVTLDSAKKITLPLKKITEDTVIIDPGLGERTLQPVHSFDADDEIEVTEQRDRSPSPAKNPPSSYLHLENLVRPFTVKQLKGLIRKTATMDDEKFWINNIKSHCYFMVSSEDEAVATREALHGVSWPSGNPKTLRVDYAIMDKMWSETEGRLGEKPKVVIEIEDKENEPKARRKEVVSRERTSRRRSVEDEKRRKMPREHKEEKAEQKKESKKVEVREDSPAKMLDDLFRKTKATPCIYWLPLTDEQISEREKTVKEIKDRNSPVRRSSLRRSPMRRSPVRRSPMKRQFQQRQDRDWR